MEENDYKKTGKLLNRKELAERWGCCIETVKRMQNSGVLRPVVFTGRLIRYRVEDVRRIEENMLLLPNGKKQCLP
jgi:predicted site-specific integrase-resolvase